MSEKSIPVISHDEFHELASKNPGVVDESPWIVDGLIENWPNFEKWRQLDYLRDRFGELNAYARAPQFVTNRNAEIVGVETSFAQYLDYIDAPERAKEIYDGCWLYGSYEEFAAQKMPLYCGSLRFVRSANDPIFEELTPFVPPPLENWNHALPYYYQLFNHLWLLVSLPGALTPLHEDNNATVALVAQLKGRKRAILFNPEDRPHYYNPDVGYMDPLAPDEKDFPTWRSATPWVGEMGPGQMLVVGPYWAHHVQTVEDSISVSLDYVNGQNIAGYAAAPQWAKVFGDRIKRNPAVISDKAPERFSVAKIEETESVTLGRQVMAHILRSAVQGSDESKTTVIRRSFLSHLEEHL